MKNFLKLIDGVYIVLNARLIDIITGGTPAGALEKAKAKSTLIGTVISRSKFTLEQVEILKSDLLKTYKAVGMAITQELFGTIVKPKQ